MPSTDLKNIKQRTVRRLLLRKDVFCVNAYYIPSKKRSKCYTVDGVTLTYDRIKRIPLLRPIIFQSRDIMRPGRRNEVARAHRKPIFCSSPSSSTAGNMRRRRPYTVHLCSAPATAQCRASVNQCEGGATAVEPHWHARCRTLGCARGFPTRPRTRARPASRSTR